MNKDYFVLAIRNLKKRKLRSSLTIVGIFISIATIFMLVSLSLGLQGAVEEQFRTLGTDKVFIQAKTGFLGPPGSVGGVILTEKDVNVIEKTQGVKSVTYMTIGNGKIEFNDVMRYYFVIGIPLEDEKATLTLTEASSLEPEEGRFLRKGDGKEIAIGSLYNKNELFGKEIIVGNKITINEEKFKVVGEMKTVGNPGDDQNIYMPLETFKELFNSGEKVDSIFVQIEDNGDINEVSDRIEKDLRKSRGLTEKTQDFEILKPEELLESFGNILNIITVFLSGVAAISLLVGGIGIANTMYTSVLERTREIGVMKAIGARNKDVLYIFMIESGLLGFIGGIMGVLLGYGASKSIEYIAINQLNTTLLQVSFPISLIIGCLVFGFLIGGLSGTLPAIQASKTNVVDALRYE
tara:strand:- start:584 stop:1807 length:1224 start_codon:yes stop_codon:yes gene_type:complete